MSTMTSTPRTAEPAAGGRPPRKRRLIVAVVVVVAVLLAGVGVWLVAFSSVFGVGTVAVRGTRVLAAAQVRAAADISAGTPLIRLDTDAVQRRVQALPEVAAVHVDTSYPSTVTITVVERTAVGYVRTAGMVRLVDRTGRSYRTVTKAPTDVPRLVLPSGGGASSAATARAVAGVAQALPVTLRATTSSIQAISPQSVTVLLDRRRVVQWGSATRNADKARVLPVLLRGHDLHIDVSDPDQPFTR